MHHAELNHGSKKIGMKNFRKFLSVRLIFSPFTVFSFLLFEELLVKFLATDFLDNIFQKMGKEGILAAEDMIS